MKTHLFFVTRMFSGLFESIEKSEWKPTGIPAFVKLAEKLSMTHRLTWIISCRNRSESLVAKQKYKHLTLHNIDIHVVTFNIRFGSQKINAAIADVLTTLYCIKLSKSAEKKLFYLDRSNIVVAAILKMFFRALVVVRILGVYPDQKYLATRLGSKLRSPLIYFSYKAPFDTVICTQDGSGVEYYLEKLIHRNTPRWILLNGTVMGLVGKSLSQRTRLSLLFAGKLIEDKGIIELIEAVTRLKNANLDFDLRIAGKGHLQEIIKDKIIEIGLKDHVTIMGSVSHEKMNSLYANTDVYISLNKLGNLSNTVLEAMSAGKCIIMLGKDEDSHIDEYTERIVPSDAVIRINRNNIVGNLASALMDLNMNRHKVSFYSGKMQEFSKTFLWPWDERIDYELNLLKNVFSRGSKS